MVAAREFGRRVQKVKTVESAISIHGTTGGGRQTAVIVFADRALSNRPLHLTVRFAARR
jgi:hypothetical protein